MICSRAARWTEAELTARLRRRGATPMSPPPSSTTSSPAATWTTPPTPATGSPRARARGYGAARLRAELRARGVATPLIEAAVAPLDRGDQLEQARRLARRRLPALARVAPDKAGARLRDHLLRRGFPGTVVAQVVREVAGQVGREDSSADGRMTLP